ncbi:thymidylate kinase isoform X1 [Apis mellifera caucasica]|uniref:Thymidylate kinase n=2 Tax=Apis mellifera TaxID=7460 RepID=A0A7M7RB97_APIME|nr:thymidylate kinase isoform X1 [Apis mellifera]KAG6801926.1 thymidylate kinase isoform X1 [Apis mellifera caucasica]KAG9433396.1 thymidylate kinase isoform X1 [Apis mellifera carnica]|eukprot:XP_624530.3 thymidylate kinase isoform X1 [Apis mellifera]
MSIRRGALIVLEGCDRAGKSTQAKMLITALNNLNIPVELHSFPNRTTTIGEIINNFLTKKTELPPETIHLLFSANRWECKDEILKTLYKGTTLIIDRYAASGAAYTAATTGKNLNWCREPDSGLPSPDLVIYLSISKKSQSLRSNWGDERFENVEFQELVASNYEKLIDKTWYVINADDDKSVIHSQILEKVIDTIKNVKHSPIEKLYESDKNS